MKKLYKYYAVNSFSLSTLANEMVWFSDPDTFNDPFDTKIFQYEKFRYSNNYKVRILCLSGNKDNLLMWSHYADSHKGFCVEFTDWSDMEFEDQRKKGLIPPEVKNDELRFVTNARDVIYKTTEEINKYISQLPADFTELNKLALSGKRQQEWVDKIIDDALFIKHKDWSYEEEFRLIRDGQNLHPIPGKITGVYFGKNMSHLNKRMLITILHPSLFKDLKLYQMERQINKYSLTPREFDLDRDFKDLDMILKRIKY